MPNLVTIRACYVKWHTVNGRQSETDLALCIKAADFIKELESAKERGLLDRNGWLNLIIAEKDLSNGDEKYSHHIKAIRQNPSNRE